MTRSETPTGYLLIKAHTGSDWDGCDAAILKIDIDWLHKQQQRISLLQHILTDSEFFQADFFEYGVEFFNDDTLSEELLGDDTACFIDITSDELVALQRPEQRIETASVLFGKGTGIGFKAYGKDSTDEYYTEDIDLIETYGMYGTQEQVS